MDIRYIAVICFGALSLFLCLFTGIFAKKEKMKSYISFKGLTSFSYIVLALVCCNMVYHINAFSMFVVCALAGFMLSAIVKALPTKTDMFRALYTLIDAISFAFALTASFFISSLPWTGLIIGMGIFLIMLIVYLVLKKSSPAVEKLACLGLILTSSLLFGVSINTIISAFSIQALLMLIGSTIMLTSSILQIFIPVENKKGYVAKTVLLDLGLIMLAISIFMI